MRNSGITIKFKRGGDEEFKNALEYLDKEGFKISVVVRNSIIAKAKSLRKNK